MGILTAILLLVFEYFFCFLYFDGIYSEIKLNSKKNNRYCVSLFLYETILVLLYNFFGKEEYQAILLFAFAIDKLIIFFHNINIK